MPLLLRPEGGSVANCNGCKASKQYTAFTVGNLGFFLKVQTDSVQAVQCLSNFSEINAELPRRTKLNIQLNLFGMM